MIQILGKNYSNQELRGVQEAFKGLRRLIQTWLSISKTRTESLANRLKSKWHRRRRHRWQIQSSHPSRQRKSLRKRNMIVLCKYLGGLTLTMMVKFLQNGLTSQKYQLICLKLWAHFSVRWMSCVIHLMLMNSSMLWEDSMTQFQCQRKAFYSLSLTRDRDQSLISASMTKDMNTNQKSMNGLEKWPIEKIKDRIVTLARVCMLNQNVATITILIYTP